MSYSSEDSPTRQSPDLPNWEERLTADLRRVCPDWDGAQRRTTLRILKTWGRWLSPAPPDPWEAESGICFLPGWFLERCPFISGGRLRLCLRFLAGLWSVRRPGFNETLAALSDLRRELDTLRRQPWFAALLGWRAA
jgi:hypothetical protein